jgi:hypothetical protein
VADEVDPAAQVIRGGVDFSFAPVPSDDLRDWRTRMYLIWFCYAYENIMLMRKPLFALEELILEFKAPGIIDMPYRRLGSLYAGAGGFSDSDADRAEHLESLKPHYERATALLVDWTRGSLD